MARGDGILDLLKLFVQITERRKLGDQSGVGPINTQPILAEPEELDEPRVSPDLEQRFNFLCDIPRPNNEKGDRGRPNCSRELERAFARKPTY